mmetsp:Transcript_56962/g.144526  ORF Transcript_56962/g.144526 Transcript_56962/m.144526 type:complete len:201 (-) Transcript_56962:889-1491(-)
MRLVPRARGKARTLTTRGQWAPARRRAAARRRAPRSSTATVGSGTSRAGTTRLGGSGPLGMAVVGRQTVGRGTASSTVPSGRARAATLMGPSELPLPRTRPSAATPCRRPSAACLGAPGQRPWTSCPRRQSGRSRTRALFGRSGGFVPSWCGSRRERSTPSSTDEDPSPRSCSKFDCAHQRPTATSGALTRRSHRSACST